MVQTRSKLCVCVCAVHGFHLHPRTVRQEYKFCWPKNTMYADECGWPMVSLPGMVEQRIGFLHRLAWYICFDFAPNYIALLSLAIKRRAWGHWSSVHDSGNDVSCVSITSLPVLLSSLSGNAKRIQATDVEIQLPILTEFFLKFRSKVV